MVRLLAVQFAGLVLLVTAVLAVDVLSTHIERQRLLAPQREAVAQLRRAGVDPCRDARYICGGDVPTDLRIPGVGDPPVGWREGASLLQAVDEVARQRRRVLVAVLLLVWLGVLVVPELLRHLRLQRAVAGVLDPQATTPPAALQSAFSGTVRDLVDARRRLVAAERFETMGLFAGGIAHQIGNPLAALRQYVDLLQADVANGRTPDPELVAKIAELTERMDRAVGALARLSRPERIRLTPVSLAKLVERVSMSISRGVPIEWTVDVPADAVARADDVMLEQVLINLLRNAVEAQDVPIILVRATRERDRWLLTIQDHGPGFPDGFDPAHAFATSKASGTGLGLPLALRLLELMGCEVRFDNTAEGGRVTLFLPAATDEKTVH